MYDESYVRFIYAHTEGYGGYDHIDLLHQELVLVLGSGLRVKTCVIWQSLDTVDVEQLCELLHLLSAEAIDDSGLAGILPYISDDILLRVGLVTDLVVKVGAVER